ncbi:MAG: type I toxin-antitoxin system SymE family toxin, partial [bacterium]|nr:type I toxin-antitoxin system SymE family toxin [bacterium]
MRKRTPDSTTAPADSWFWFITEKGLRTSGAASMRSTAASLRETATELEKAARRLDQEVPAPPDGGDEMTPLNSRRGTVCYLYRKEKQVPHLRLSGQWLEQAGFDRGR